MPNVAIVPSENPQVEILDAVVDGWPDVVHRIETTAGGAPIETGAHITDHAIAREDKLRLTGWVSDFRGVRGSRASEAWETVRRLHQSVTPVEVITPRGVYPEMLLLRAETSDTGLGMRFTLDLQQVIRVGIAGGDLTAADVSGPATRRTSLVERGRVIPEAD